MGSASGPLRQTFKNKKLAFYSATKSEVSADKNTRYLSETQGFFNIRQNRNVSNLSATSKSFHNYLKAKERAQSLAKSYYEKQNLIALTKAKNEKLVEKQVKMEEMIRKDKMEKLHEKQRLIKHRRDIDNKGRERDAFEMYKNNISEIKSRTQQKLQKDRELSMKNFN
jgi:hypothetical protein